MYVDYVRVYKKKSILAGCYLLNEELLKHEDKNLPAVKGRIT